MNFKIVDGSLPLMKGFNQIIEPTSDTAVEYPGPNVTY
jgi:hypothetical protein